MARPLHKRNELTYSRDMALLKRLYHAIKLDTTLDPERVRVALTDLERAFNSVKALRDSVAGTVKKCG
jgi:hypothetical protein